MSSKKPKVSIVVPIYGVEKYLRQCVDSILAQTLKDIEVILVDDGSPDKCPQIVDEYAAKDSRVVAVHQPNGGYGCAVNHGMELANAPYIGIIESDDWIEPAMYEKLYNNAIKNDSDIVKCSFYKYDSLAKKEKYINKKWKTTYMDLFDAPNGAFCLRDYPNIVMFHASVWASIYRADFLRSNNIKMIETAKTMYQDFPFMCEVMSRAKRISVEKDYLVHYRLEDGQNSSTKQRGEKLIQMASRCIDAIEILNKNGVLDLCFEEIYLHAYTTNAGFFKDIKWEFKAKYFDELRRLFLPLNKNKFSFTYKHFNKYQKKFVQYVLANDFINATKKVWVPSFANIRRFFISIRLPSDNFKGWRFQIFGMTIGNCIDYVQPSLIRIHIGTKNISL